jgi:murein DD-endopeptidase MepM/ murein hydrolase activator NlpD
LEAATARYAIRRRIRLLDGITHPPCTAGFLGGTVVVPTADGTWSREKREAVLLHEAAHIKRGDVPCMTFIELIAAAAWCVPFMPFVIRSLIEDREEACDEATIEMGAKPSAYASLILELTARRPYAPLIGDAGMVGRTRTEARIKKIIDRNGRERENRTLGRAAMALLIVAGLTVGGTGTLSRVFALEAADAKGIETSSADGLVGGGYPTTDLPTASPLVGKWRVTQGFGKRKHPITGESYQHVGIDLANGRAGDPVLATLAGKVVQADYEKTSGNSVVVGDGRLLVRFSKLKDIRVAVGDRVQVGTEIGTVGATGVATGPHLHYEIWVDGNAVDPADPLKAGGARFDGLGEE